MAWPDYPAVGPNSARRKLLYIIQNSDGEVNQHANRCLQNTADQHVLHATTSDETKYDLIKHAHALISQGTGAGYYGHPDYQVVLEDLNHEAGGGAALAVPKGGEDGKGKPGKPKPGKPKPGKPKGGKGKPKPKPTGKPKPKPKGKGKNK